MGISSDCKSIFEKISDNKKAIFILNAAEKNNCFSEYIRMIHDERPHLKNKPEYLNCDFPLLTVSSNKSSYNPISRIYNIEHSNEFVINKEVDEQISKAIYSLKNPSKLFFSYGNTEDGKIIDLIQNLEELIKLIYPNIFTKYDKILENYNKPLSSYEDKLINGDMIIFLVNKEFFQSRYAMRELNKIYNNFIKKNKEFSRKDDTLPPQTIFIKNDEIRKIFDDNEECDEHIFSYWNKMLEISKEKLERIPTDTGKNREKSIINEIEEIIKNLPILIEKIEKNYDHKKTSDHIDSNISSALWAISEYIKNQGKFDFQNTTTGKEFNDYLSENINLLKSLGR